MTISGVIGLLVFVVVFAVTQLVFKLSLKDFLNGFSGKCLYEFLNIFLVTNGFYLPFESLKQLFGASLPIIESTSNKNESTSENIGSTSHNSESSSVKVGALSHKFESTLPDFESTLSNFGATLYNNGATSIKPESSSPDNGALSPGQELASPIERLARESLKIYYSQPNIIYRLYLGTRPLTFEISKKDLDRFKTFIDSK